VESIKPVDSTQIKALIDKYSPFVAEARKRILRTLGIFALSTIFGFLFYEDIIKFLIKGLSLEGINIVFTSPFQFINLAISCGVATGIIVVIPFLIMQIIYFLKPALREKEYRLLVRFIPLSMLLFALGFIFGAVIMKWQIEIFLTRSVSLGIGNILDISGLLSTVFLTSALMGVGFQFPIILLILLRLGVIKHKSLSGARRWVYLISFIFVLFLPPDSILADFVLTIPFIGLYEMTLIINRLYPRKKN